jgi:hypothetical protein
MTGAVADVCVDVEEEEEDVEEYRRVVEEVVIVGLGNGELCG